MNKELVINWVKTMFKSMGDGDFDTFCNICAEEVNLYPPDSRPVRGLDELKKLTKPWFDTYHMSHEITEISVNAEQNLAYAFVQYIDTIKPKIGGEEIVTPNKTIYILRMEPDISLKAIDVMWNRNPK